MYEEILRMINDIENVDLSDKEQDEKEDFLLIYYNNLLDLIRGTTSISLKERIELGKIVKLKKDNILNLEFDYEKNNVPKVTNYEEEKTKNIAFMAAKIRYDDQSSLKKFLNRLLNKESFKVYRRNYKFLSIDQINELYRRK